MPYSLRRSGQTATVSSIRSDCRPNSCTKCNGDIDTLDSPSDPLYKVQPFLQCGSFPVHKPLHKMQLFHRCERISVQTHCIFIKAIAEMAIWRMNLEVKIPMQRQCKGTGGKGTGGDRSRPRCADPRCADPLARQRWELGMPTPIAPTTRRHSKGVPPSSLQRDHSSCRPAVLPTTARIRKSFSGNVTNRNAAHNLTSMPRRSLHSRSILTNAIRGF